MTNSFDMRDAIHLSDTDRALLGRRDSVLGASYRLFYEEPVAFTRGSGVHLYTADGRRFLDAYNNVPVVGHANPGITQVAAAQLATLNVHTRYLSDPVVSYAETLLSLMPASIQQVLFACSGSEAVDLALRMARHVTKREGVIISSHAYHGTTTASAAVSPSLGAGNPLPATTELVDVADLVDLPEELRAEELASRVRVAIDALRLRGIEVAALLLDSALSSDGLLLDPPGLLAPAVDVVRDAGGLYIADEVQAGFGRLGPSWWGFERHGVEPDLVVMGKPMGNGYPVSAVVGRSDVMSAFGADVRYFNTFAGADVGMAIAAEVLRQLQDGVVEAVAPVGARLRNEVARLSAAHSNTRVRGEGLFLAVDFRDSATGAPDRQTALAVSNAMRREQVLTSVSGKDENVLKVRPPLVFGQGDVDEFVQAYASALDAVVAK